jgi:hypothetical protein
MKTAQFFAMAFLATAGISLIAQETGADGSEKAVYAPQGPMSYGDEASSRAYEMTSVTGELEGKLEARNAKVDDRVILKTTEKVQTSDGTVIPRGTRIVGHITQVQTRDSAHGVSQIAIAFDRAELKSGQSLAIHTLIRGVNSSSGVMGMNSDNPMSAVDDPLSGGSPSGGTGGGRGGRGGSGQSGILGGATQKTSPTTSSVGDRTGATTNADTSGAVQLAGHGEDVNENTGAHQLAAARSVPHPTAIPGVMLAGNSSSSGVFLASRKDLEFASGTQMQLGIVADR